MKSVIGSLPASGFKLAIMDMRIELRDYNGICLIDMVLPHPILFTGLE
jgi:hypothetical protein